MTALSGRVGRSVAWSVAGSAIMRVGQLLVGIVAARLLAPEQFGVFAVTLVVYNIVVNISELGVASALIRSPEAIEELAPTAVTVALASAAALAGLMTMTAPLVAHGFGIPQAAGPIVVMSLVVLLAGPSAVPSAVLTSRFRQDKRLLADASNFVGANSLLIVLAVNGGGAYALAWSRVAGQAISLVVLIAVAGKFYWPGMRRKALRYLLGLGLPLVGANLIGYAVSAVDVVVVGHMLGATQLGVYNLAGNVASWPMQLMLPVLANVGLPLVALFQADRKMLRDVVGSLTAATASLFLPVIALLAVLSHLVVLTLYGHVWSGAGPVLAVLAIAGGIRVFLVLYFDVLVASNATGTLFVIQFVWLATLLPAVIVGIHLDGPVGAAAGAAGTVGLVVLPLTIVSCHRRVGLSVSSIGRSAAWFLLVAAAAATASWWVAATIGDGTPLIALLTAGGVGTLVYCVLAQRSCRSVMRRLRTLIDQRPAIAGSTEHGVDDRVVATTLELEGIA